MFYIVLESKCFNFKAISAFCRIRVAAAAAASSMARIPSIRKLTALKGAVSEDYSKKLKYNSKFI